MTDNKIIGYIKFLFFVVIVLVIIIIIVAMIKCFSDPANCIFGVCTSNPIVCLMDPKKQPADDDGKGDDPNKPSDDPNKPSDDPNKPPDPPTPAPEPDPDPPTPAPEPDPDPPTPAPEPEPPGPDIDLITKGRGFSNKDDMDKFDNELKKAGEIEMQNTTKSSSIPDFLEEAEKFTEGGEARYMNVASKVTDPNLSISVKSGASIEPDVIDAECDKLAGLEVSVTPTGVKKYTLSSKPLVDRLGEGAKSFAKTGTSFAKDVGKNALEGIKDSKLNGAIFGASIGLVAWQSYDYGLTHTRLQTFGYTMKQIGILAAWIVGFAVAQTVVAWMPEVGVGYLASALGVLGSVTSGIIPLLAIGALAWGFYSEYKNHQAIVKAQRDQANTESTEVGARSGMSDTFSTIIQRQVTYPSGTDTGFITDNYVGVYDENTQKYDFIYYLDLSPIDQIRVANNDNEYGVYSFTNQVRDHIRDYFVRNQFHTEDEFGTTVTITYTDYGGDYVNGTQKTTTTTIQTKDEYYFMLEYVQGTTGWITAPVGNKMYKFICDQVTQQWSYIMYTKIDLITEYYFPDKINSTYKDENGDVIPFYFSSDDQYNNLYDQLMTFYKAYIKINGSDAKDAYLKNPKILIELAVNMLSQQDPRNFVFSDQKNTIDNSIVPLFVDFCNNTSEYLTAPLQTKLSDPDKLVTGQAPPDITNATAAQISALTSDQLILLTQTQITAFTQTQLSGLDPTQILLLSPTQASYFTDDQKKLLSSLQQNALTQAQNSYNVQYKKIFITSSIKDQTNKRSLLLRTYIYPTKEDCDYLYKPMNMFYKNIIEDGRILENHYELPPEVLHEYAYMFYYLSLNVYYDVNTKSIKNMLNDNDVDQTSGMLINFNTIDPGDGSNDTIQSRLFKIVYPNNIDLDRSGSPVDLGRIVGDGNTNSNFKCTTRQGNQVYYNTNYTAASGDPQLWETGGALYSLLSSGYTTGSSLFIQQGNQVYLKVVRTFGRMLYGLLLSDPGFAMNLFGYFYTARNYYSSMGTNYISNYVDKWIANSISLIPNDVPYSVTDTHLSEFYPTVYTELQYNNNSIQPLDTSQSISPTIMNNGKYILNPDPTYSTYNTTKSIDYYISYAQNLPGCIAFSIDTSLNVKYFMVPDEINQTPTSQRKYGVAQDNSKITLQSSEKYLFTFCKYIQCIYNCVDNQCVYSPVKRLNYTVNTPFINNFKPILDDYFPKVCTLFSKYYNLNDDTRTSTLFLMFERRLNATTVGNSKTTSGRTQQAAVTKDIVKNWINSAATLQGKTYNSFSYSLMDNSGSVYFYTDKVYITRMKQNEQYSDTNPVYLKNKDSDNINDMDVLSVVYNYIGLRITKDINSNVNPSNGFPYITPFTSNQIGAGVVDDQNNYILDDNIGKYKIMGTSGNGKYKIQPTLVPDQANKINTTGLKSSIPDCDSDIGKCITLNPTDPTKQLKPYESPDLAEYYDICNSTPDCAAFFLDPETNQASFYKEGNLTSSPQTNRNRLLYEVDSGAGNKVPTTS